MSQSITILPDRAVFEISGPEANGFLQGLVTNDVENLGAGSAAHTGLLTPQGKIMFDFFVIGQADGFLIDCASSQIDDLVKRLGFYKLRAKVEINTRSDLAVAASWGDHPQNSDDMLIIDDPRLAAMGQRLIAPEDVLEPLSNLQPNDYHLHRIVAGVADTVDIGSSQCFPHEANFDQLGGVSFTKGCYVGQEVVSRMQHRGTARSRIVSVSFNGQMSEPHAEIQAAGKKIGHMLSAVDNHGLALIRLDRAKSAIEAGDLIEANGKSLELIKPQWANFEM